MEAVKLKNINKSFNGKKVLNNVNLNIYQNEIFGLIGRNGAGKSTLLHIISGIIYKTSGEVLVSNNKNPEKIKEEIGVMPDSSNLYQNLTALSFLKYMGNIKKVNHPTNYYYEILNKVGLENVERKKLKDFSFGMKKKISIAQAILGNPSLIILDEPTSGLDPESSIKIRKLILELKRQGKTIFLTSHNFEEIEEICDRLAIMNKGTIAKIGTIKELKEDSNLVNLKIKTLGTLTSSQFDYINQKLNNINQAITSQEDCYIYIQLSSIEQIPKTIELLITNDIKILEVVQQHHSLQDIFLSI
ncbi:ABC transporter ATP-binding protein [Escherichia coli]|uniref:ABC transporter ATP-binding protein n=1 Tax=Escherichia coli TaxID=562 RepID=UPI003DA93793